MAKRKRKKGTPNLPVPNPERAAPKLVLGDITDTEVVKLLFAYWNEADFNRKGGPSPRDRMWRELIDLYWNRFDFSKKATWQAREVMPEVPMIVDRFAAAMREALTSQADWFTVEVPNDDEEDMSEVIKKVMKVLLENCGRDSLGHTVQFETVFEELMKLGALAVVSGVVTWKQSGKGRGYVAVEPLDPRTVWLDTTGRNLYRIRRYEIEKSQLLEMAQLEDSDGNPIYDLDAIEQLSAEILLRMHEERARLTGNNQFNQSSRQTVTIDEYLCTLIGTDGKLLAENVLCVVANERWLIRGPEANPFWHQTDWLFESPLVTAPLSPYGKAYIENVATIARTFNELTNLILDGAFTTALKAFAMNPNALMDPTQVDEGIWPNKIFKLEDGQNAKEFFAQLDLGELPAEAIQIWQSLKSELQEAAAMNELSLGQFAPKGRTSASEIMSVQNNSSTLMRSIAKNVEQRVLEIVLNLMWKTWLQHMPKSDEEMSDVLGDQWYSTIYKARKELAEKRITFQVRGISALVARMQKLQQLLNLLQVVGQNQILMQALMQETTPQRLLEVLMKLSDIDIDDLKPTQREMLMQQVAAASQQQQQPPGGSGGPPGAAPALPPPNPAVASAAASPVSNAAPTQ